MLVYQQKDPPPAVYGDKFVFVSFTRRTSWCLIYFESTKIYYEVGSGRSSDFSVLAAFPVLSRTSGVFVERQGVAMEFTAAGLSGILTRFPFHLPGGMARSNTWTMTKIYFFQDPAKPFFCIYFSKSWRCYRVIFVFVTIEEGSNFGSRPIKSVFPTDFILLNSSLLFYEFIGHYTCVN